MPAVIKTFQYGNRTVSIKTGDIARQANGAVWVNMDDTVVLVTAVAKESLSDGDFFPLTVNVQARSYAVGRVPGGYFKREGKPSDNETLTARLIDRPIRPLFPKGFNQEVQIIATILSVNPQVQPDIPAMIGASAALAISGLPFMGPLSAARVGYKEGAYLLNPTIDELENTELDMVVAGTEQAVLMVESEARELSEDVMLGAVMFAHREMQVAINAIKALAAETSKPAWTWQAPQLPETITSKVSAFAKDKLVEAYQITSKQERRKRIEALNIALIDHMVEGLDDSADEELILSQTKNSFYNLEKSVVREQILDGKPRIDGRDTRTVRPISIDMGVLPRTHGSVVFTRGETQAIVVATLGTERDAQVVENLGGDYKENFMLHYNFPPFSVGEVGFVGSPKRREIGHGNLAKRSLMAVLPTQKEFSYVLRVVSEITESNGSSSMATVCGASLALMDAGVPIRSHVAGIAMGLVKEGDRYQVLTDILGDEDHLGDMDFKVAGTLNGVTALQMDIKINGINEEIMRKALDQARDGRVHILGIMNEVITAPRSEMSAYAPRILNMRISPDRIRDVIGKGGITIRSITEETGTVVDISDDGEVKVAAADLASCEEAIRRIERLTADVNIGEIYEGTVVKLADFGAFVSVLPGKQGLVHISQICKERVEKVSDKLHEGQVVKVKVLDIDKQGKIRLSMKEVASEDQQSV